MALILRVLSGYLLLTAVTADLSYADTIRLQTIPSGASVWLVKGRTTSHVGVTPFDYEFSFRSTKDTKRVEIRRLGYESKKYHISPNRKFQEVALQSARLLPKNSKVQNTKLEKMLADRINDEIYAASTDPLAGSRFSVEEIAIEYSADHPIIRVLVKGEDGFGGRRIKSAYRKRKSSERQLKAAGYLLDDGLYELISWVGKLVRGSEIKHVILNIIFEVRGLSIKEELSELRRKSIYIDAGDWIIKQDWFARETFQELVDEKEHVEMTIVAPLSTKRVEPSAYTISEFDSGGAVFLKIDHQ